MPDFEVRAFEGISADMLAELLLYLIAKGIVTLPIASDKALLDMPWGSHVCQFYDGKEDLVKMLVPYFKQGLDRNEACVWLVGDLTVEEARNALAARRAQSRALHGLQGRCKSGITRSFIRTATEQ